MSSSRSSLELLESRIAPASLNSAAKVLTYTDIDGDHVTITFSKAVAASDFTFNTATFDDSGPQQLEAISLPGGGGALHGLKITLAVKGVPGGDGLAAVGAIQAAGVDLGAVKLHGDLGRITSGAIASLEVQSLGHYGTATQDPAGAPSLTSTTGIIGSFVVAHDVEGVTLNIDPQKLSIGGDIGTASMVNLGRISSITVGGSVTGGSVLSMITAGSITLGRDLASGSGIECTGTLDVDGDIRSVKIGGSISDGILSAEGTVKLMTVAGNIADGSQLSFSDLTSLTVSGSLTNGSIYGNDGLGSIKIGHDVNATSMIHSPAAISSLTISGSLAGGSTVSTGGNIVSLSVGASVTGGAQITAGESVLKLTVKGSVTGSAAIKGADLGAIAIGGDVSGASLAATAHNFQSLKIGGSLSSGTITAHSALGNVTIGGSVMDSEILVDIDGGSAAATIGAIIVKGNWRTSDLVAGVSEIDDTVGYGSSSNIQLVAQTAKIASITIGGTVSGSGGDSDTYGFDAASIGSFKLGGYAVPLPAAPGSVTLSQPSGGNVKINLLS